MPLLTEANLEFAATLTYCSSLLRVLTDAKLAGHRLAFLHTVQTCFSQVRVWCSFEEWAALWRLLWRLTVDELAVVRVIRADWPFVWCLIVSIKSRIHCVSMTFDTWPSKYGAHILLSRANDTMLEIKQVLVVGSIIVSSIPETIKISNSNFAALMPNKHVSVRFDIIESIKRF